jgi:hypothetical protein
MQRNQLRTKQILSRRNALRDSHHLLALVRNQAVNTPLRAVKAVFVDFEPAA